MFHYSRKAFSDLEITHTRVIRDDNGVLLAYIHELTPEGFIITSADTNVRAVLGFSFESSFPFIDTKDNGLLHLIKWDVKGRLKALEVLNQKTAGLINANKIDWEHLTSDSYRSIYRAVPSQEWGPWISTNWEQGLRYNNKAPYKFPSFPSLGRRPVGCVATAMAQIINYWKYPKRVWFPSVEYPNGCAYTANGINFDGDAIGYGFPTFSQLESSLSSINYNDDDDEVANLCLGAGIWVRMSYALFGSGAHIYDDVPRAFTQGFSYGSAVPNRSWNYSKPYVVSNLKAARPVLLGIHESSGWNGHAVIIDGYRDSDDFFHLNFGWGIMNPWNPWYALPNSYSSYDSIHAVIYDIIPKSGWPQYGGDERNTFSSIFRAPINDPPVEKWQVSTSFLPNHHFQGMVVGPDNKIFATFSPKIMGGIYHPGVSVFNQFGERQEAYYLTGETNGIDYPVVNSNWQVFVVTDEGGVYLVDTINKSTVKIFQEPYGDEFSKPKIDSDDLLYLCTDNHLYCLSTEGTQQWSFAPPAGRKMYRGMPLIDVSRNYIYVGYYDSVTKISYLGCIDRQIGVLKYEKSFTGIDYSSRMTGVPSIADDGTIFVGCYTNLYALRPGSNSFSEKWKITNGGNNTNAPAIGPDGTIYIGYYEQIAGSWYYSIAALAPDDGTESWKRSFLMGTYDVGLQPYVASNGVVLTRILREQTGNDTFELSAYLDNGNSSTLLWHKEYSDVSGGDIAFGPNDTLYVLPSSTGSIIYALSQGSVGDAYQGGMGFTDNSPPDTPQLISPANGASDQSTTGIQLTWAGSDPDGNSLKYDVLACELSEGQEASFVQTASQISTNSYTITNLKQGTKYLWAIVATDGQGISESPSWSFTTVNVPPSIVSVAPQAGSINVPINTAIVVEFSESLDPTTINDNTFVLNNGVQGTVSYAPNTKTAAFVPHSDLASSTNFTATITTGVRDLLGDGLSADYGWNFQTGMAPDTTPPTVSFCSPANNEINIDVSSVITATFSENMDASTISASSFTVSEPSGPITGTVTCSGTTATFTPAYDLDYSTEYKATITTEVKDLAGNNMGSNHNWTFTTDINPAGGQSSNGDGGCFIGSLHGPTET